MNKTAQKTAHTPGPWSVPHFARPDANCKCGYVLTDGYMGAVATVHCSGEGGLDWRNGDNPKFDEAVANALLIAAAPDLLTLVQSFRRTVLFYIGVDEKKGDDEGASLKRNTLMLIDETLSRAVPA